MGDPLFAWVKNGHLMPITYGFLSKMLKKWVTKTGRQVDEYTLHGLRHREMNQALVVGICSEDLQLMGDWKSNVYMEYIDLTMDRRLSNMVWFMDELDVKLELWLSQKK